eukprot:10956857-Alexandrium_andersonii.AAC.1
MSSQNDRPPECGVRSAACGVALCAARLNRVTTEDHRWTPHLVDWLLYPKLGCPAESAELCAT